MLAVMRWLVACVLLAPVAAQADRPDAWMFRATPGLGYAWDAAQSCAFDGRMFVGGFELGYFAAPGLLVGGATGISFNLLPATGPAMLCDFDFTRLRFAMMFTFGPIVDWYPMHNGLHVAAHAGYATTEQDSRFTGRGVGGSLAVGYDWHWERDKNGHDHRLGVQLQTTLLRTTQDHATIMTALLFTIGVD